MRVPTFWSCVIIAFCAMLLLPTPMVYEGNFEGFAIFAAWYHPKIEAPSWIFAAHTVVATIVACFWTHWLGRNDSSRQRGIRWMLVYITFCAIILALLRYVGASAQTVGTLLVPLAAYFVLPWFMRNHVRLTSPTDGH